MYFAVSSSTGSFPRPQDVPVWSEECEGAEGGGGRRGGGGG